MLNIIQQAKKDVAFGATSLKDTMLFLKTL